MERCRELSLPRQLRIRTRAGAQGGETPRLPGEEVLDGQGREVFRYERQRPPVKAFAKARQETEWRKNPTHQGGFLLDGGVHVTAGLRLLLGPENTVARLSAYSARLQKHLPPLDTIDATMRTKSGATGTFSVSFGTSFTGYDFSIACEGGTVNLSVFESTVSTVFEGKEEKVKVADEKTGVPPEVRKWGEALAAGGRNDKQIPEEALADLELVSGAGISR